MRLIKQSHSFLVLLAIIFGLNGCGAPKPKPPAAQLTERADPGTLALIEAAGSRASLVVIVHPQRWTAARRTLQPLLSGLHAELDSALAGENLFRAAASFSDNQSPFSAGLQGWDQTRPIVAALFEPQSSDLILAARAVIPQPQLALKKGLPGIRHRILIPATKPQSLVASLEKLLVYGDAEPAQTKSLPQGARLLALPDKHGFVALFPEKGKTGPTSKTASGFVRLELVTDERIPHADEQARITYWEKQLAETKRDFDLPITPALIMAASQPDLLVLHVRPWQLRDLAAQIATRQVFEALAFTDSSMKAMLLAKGLSIVANSTLLMTPLGAEIDDFTLSIDIDGGFRISSLFSLTKKGQNIFKAGLAKAVSPFRTSPGRYFLTLWSSLNWNAMLQAASPPAALAEVKELRELAEALMECGAFCNFHYLVRNPFGLARTLLDLIPENLTGQFPHSLSLAILDINPQNRKAPIRLAAAAHFPQAASTRLLRQGLAELDRDPGPGIRSQLYVEQVGQDQVVRLGLGSDPRDVFDLQLQKPPVGVIGELSLDPATLANLINPISPKAAAVLDQFGKLEARASHVDRAIAGEMLLNIKVQKKQTFSRPANFSGLDWESPGAAAAGTKGAKCMQAVTREMIRGFGSLAMAAPEMRSLVLSRLIEEIDKPLNCARQAKDTSEAAKRTQLMLALYVADQLAENYHLEAEKLVLGRACNQGHPQACERLQAIKARPPIRLAQVDNDCQFSYVGGRPFIRLASGGEPVEPAALDEALAVGNLAPALIIDRDTKYSRIAEVLGRVAQDRDNAQVLVESKDQKNQAIFVSLLTSRKKEKIDKDKKIKKKLTGVLGVLQEGADKPDPLIVLKVRGPKVELASNGTLLTFEGTSKCPTETSCRTTADLNKELAEQRKLLGPHTKTYLDADPETTFKQLAPILVLAACATRQDQYNQDLELPVIFGPVPDEIFERAKTAPKQGGLSGTGIGGLGTFGKISGKSKNEMIIGGGSLPKEEIQRVIRENINVVRYCYEKQLVKNPSLQGKVTVKFIISPTGRVQQAEVKSSTLKNKTVEKCLTHVVRRWRFPKPMGGGIVIVNYPFVFKSK